MSIKNNTTSLQSLLDAINALPDGLTWKDEFVYGTAYDVNDVVSFEGSSYVCVRAVDKNSELTPNMNTDSWNLIARAGTDGVSVVNVYRKSAGFGSGAANTIAVELSSGEIKTFNIYNGEQGESATITEVTATVDTSVGTPSVAVTMGGTDTNRTFDFAFSNLKGEDGRTPVKGTDYSDGEDGKTAYQYAQDGGYTGTEAEFAAKLAAEYEVNPLTGKKVSFLGDSICVGSDETSNYGRIIADRNGMVYENVGHAGATVTAETYSNSTGNPKPWLCRMVANMSADADYAIIEGGINDSWDDTVREKIGSITKGYNATLDDSTYYGAFESMLKQLITKYQGKKIGYIAVPKIHGLFDSSQNAPNFYHIAMECCAKWGVPVCDLNTITPPVEYLSDLGTTYTEDGTHPTYEGYLEYYCDPIEAWMKTLTTGASVSAGATQLSDLDNKYVGKNDVQIKKAQLTLEDGSTVLIDVVVASAGTTIQKYLNLIPTSIDSTGAIYNGTGYKFNTRLSSTGIEKESGNSVATGFIPAKGGDVIRLGGGFPWYRSDANNNYLCAYDSNFAYIGGVYNSVDGYSYTKNIAASCELGNTCAVTLINDASIAYIRASWPTTSGIDGSTLIVTVNQEIT